MIHRNVYKFYLIAVMLMSVPFLILTFVVYAIFRELRNLHGKCLMCYLFGLITLYISFPLIHIAHEDGEHETLCKLNGYAAYISLMICFFWLNIMCYDIFSKFRYQLDLLYEPKTSYKLILSINRRGFGARGSDTKRFMVYCLYAFGVPFLMTTVMFILDNTDMLDVTLRAGIGNENCWIKSEGHSEMIYIYIPLTTILTFNISTYSITAYKICQVQRETSMIRGNNSKKHSIESDKNR